MCISYITCLYNQGDIAYLDEKEFDKEGENINCHYCKFANYEANEQPCKECLGYWKEKPFSKFEKA